MLRLSDALRLERPPHARSQKANSMGIPQQDNARTDVKMSKPDYAPLVTQQREYFLSGATRPISWRKGQLETLKKMLAENHDELCDALWNDLRRNVFDADLMDVASSEKEADHALKHLDAWMAPERIHTPLVLQPGHVRVRRDPFGVALIIGAWNEPFMLLFHPLAAASAAGNTAVLKPSEIAAACSAAKLTPKYFDPRAVAVVEGAVPETTALLAEEWDFIFFTGSPQVGKIVHQAAAKDLTPCVLELGGKNPTIVHSSANLKSAANSIAYGRYPNSGHICTAPDHVLVWPDVKRCVRQADGCYDPRVLWRRAKIESGLWTGDQRQELRSPRRADEEREGDCRLPERRHRALYRADRARGRLRGFADHAGGSVRPDLPVLEISSVEAVIQWVNSRPSPLGLYVFAEDSSVAERILGATRSGDAVVNDCALHPLIQELPLGGAGNSGMGKYHGRWGFEAFTNARGVVYHSARIDPRVRVIHPTRSTRSSGKSKAD